MLNTIIIEDERPAMEYLVHALNETGNPVQVNAILSSVKEGIEYLATNPKADIIFSDVQLTDGYSFEIFKHIKVTTPVIFITGYDTYMMNAFSSNGIDYILKPVDPDELRQALDKYRTLEQHFTNSYENLGRLTRQTEGKKKNRLIVRRGLEHIALKLEEVVLMYTENKLVYVIDANGKKYIGDKNLGEMELELDDTIFFRANRQYIINVNFVKGFRSFEKVKLQVDMHLPLAEHQIIISQENAPSFRQWIYEA